ncbi:transposase [Candidatus Mycolicibacterium alkanivorans]|uniref:transposase n=1 Tax=Candidatus Mycolicibacterium alkanivorans TaxID=2954114 RepID=UPI00207C0C7A|nr:transposase [Candidatus Mycolicibacterium alkanivorans]
MQTTNWSRDLGVEVRGDDVVSHTGSVIVRMLADKTGLTSALSGALARPEVIWDRGAVFRDLAVTIADGGTHICDLAVLGNQQRVFGPVASTSTMWRALNEIDTKGLTGITAARNKVRRKVWELIVDRHGMIPPVQTCYGDLGEVIGIRIDATLVNSYSDKQLASGNFKGGYGFHPLTSWCDNTGESLAIMARTGSAGSNTAADHIAIIDASIAALPVKHRRRLLITIDGAGSTHDVLDHLTALNARRGYTVEYSVGFDLDARVRGAITAMPEDVWSDVLDPTGKARDDHSGVAEITGLLRHSRGGDRLAGWPDDMRVFVRREPI